MDCRCTEKEIDLGTVGSYSLMKELVLDCFACEASECSMKKRVQEFLVDQVASKFDQSPLKHNLVSYLMVNQPPPITEEEKLDESLQETMLLFAEKFTVIVHYFDGEWKLHDQHFKLKNDSQVAFPDIFPEIQSFTQDSIVFEVNNGKLFIVANPSPYPTYAKRINKRLQFVKGTRIQIRDYSIFQSDRRASKWTFAINETQSFDLEDHQLCYFYEEGVFRLEDTGNHLAKLYFEQGACFFEPFDPQCYQFLHTQDQLHKGLPSKRVQVIADDVIFHPLILMTIKSKNLN